MFFMEDDYRAYLLLPKKPGRKQKLPK